MGFIAVSFVYSDSMSFHFLFHFNCQFVLIFSCVEYVPVYYGDYKYPQWAEVVGFLMVGVSVGMIPLMMVIVYLKETDWLEVRYSLRVKCIAQTIDVE